MVQWLVEDMGADPNPVDRFGRTPLEDAVRDYNMCPKRVAKQSHACCAQVLSTPWHNT